MKPETISKMLVNQMLLCFGTMFAAQVGDIITSYGFQRLGHCY